MLVMKSLDDYDRAREVRVNRFPASRAMNSLWARVEFNADGPVVGQAAMPVADVIASLERGKSWTETARTLDIEPIDAVAAIAVGALGEPTSLGVSLIREAPLHPSLRPALSESAIRSIVPKADRAKVLAFVAGLLQIHNFWEESHEAAQLADDACERDVSSYWHAIAHRREPDPGNAAYWFRRIGRHPVFEPLRQEAGPIIEAAGYANILDYATAWNPVAFIDFCSKARPGSIDEALVRRIQRIEMIALLDATARAIGLL